MRLSHADLYSHVIDTLVAASIAISIETPGNLTAAIEILVEEEAWVVLAREAYRRNDTSWSDLNDGVIRPQRGGIVIRKASR